MPLLDAFLPAVRTLHVTDGVRYSGSLTEAHGHYRVLAIGEDGRLTLGRHGKRVLSRVRAQSVSYVGWGLCTTCDAAPTWLRAVMVDESQASMNACLDCAKAMPEGVA